MEPRPYQHVPNSPDFAYQIKWDGVRMLSFIDRRVRLQNRKLRDRTAQYPELQALPDYLQGKSAILDGELVVLNKEGKPSFKRVIERDFSTNPKKISYLTQILPVTYMIFDILSLDGQDLTGTPWSERQDILQDIVNPSGFVFLTDNFPDGETLFQAVKAQCLEGIVAKHINSPYVAGKSDYWLKIKYRRQQLCVIGGYTVKEGRLSALLLGVNSPEGLLYVGRAGSGLSGSQIEMLSNFFAEIRRESPPFINPPLKERGLTYHWADPLLTVMIEFAEWTEDMVLRSPVIAGFTGQKPEESLFE